MAIKSFGSSLAKIFIQWSINLWNIKHYAHSRDKFSIRLKLQQKVWRISPNKSQSKLALYSWPSSGILTIGGSGSGKTIIEKIKEKCW